jgi:hypothetical protein
MKPISFHIHEDEWSDWHRLAIPDEHYTVTPSAWGLYYDHVHIHPEWRDQFVVWVTLHNCDTSQFGLELTP